MKFDPDKHYVKVRGMNGIHYEQDGHKFNAGHKHVGKLIVTSDGKAVETAEPKEDVRARARAKIAAKKGDLDGFRKTENPTNVDAMLDENAAARKAEELVE